MDRPDGLLPVIRADDARARAAALGGRRPILWDNFPVNDGTMERSLHLGPYLGREPELTDEVDGVLSNPMLQAHASQVALVEGQSAIDRLCRLALRRYQEWTQRESGALEITVDAVPVPLAPDGTFHCPGAHTVLVRVGAGVTALRAPAQSPPFPDSRLD